MKGRKSIPPTMIPRQDSGAGTGSPGLSRAAPAAGNPGRKKFPQTGYD
ncbi:MAG: hypothetical protein ACOYL3_29275 [Desulfuromonadaceae bacterium]